MRAKYFPPKEEVQAAIDRAETYNTFDSRTALYKDVATTLGVNMSTLIIKIKDMGITIRTPPAKKGRTKGQKTRVISRAEKISKFPTFNEIRNHIHKKFEHYVDKAEKGSIKAAIALKCIDCSCGQRSEITLCTQTDCGIFPYRPFQGRLHECIHEKGMVN